ncbi:MAG: alpha-amylase [candidate division Zixibacteria bacterium]|nr:alpha-amylase [candidate division Zixibacteria bacterium]
MTVAVIVDILRYVVHRYCQEDLPGVILRGLDWAGLQLGSTIVERPPAVFVDLFPPTSVAAAKQAGDEFLKGTTQKVSHREMTVGEMILLSLGSENPAFRRYRNLFDDTELRRQCPYEPLMGGLERFFDQQPPFAPLGQPLFEVLRAPMKSSPDSLDGQLQYIRDHWGTFLPADLLEMVLLATDILKEEKMMRGWGPGPNVALRFGKDVYGYDLGYPEPAAFSRDADWMSNVVIIAKSTHVWLDQLSKKYKRPIRFLNEIPDEELDTLARWGFTGLWLIGLWERSSASQTIKQIMGNPEAAASAYSLYDYTIARDLGGEEAYQDLRDRAWRRGIRLASDMVPNHMGIYSRWMLEHPEWFMQAEHMPYPSYRFTGVDLSPDERVTVQIEDGYWDRRDAAVVFKRIDQWTGDVRYIYHGNDGTSTPWNDTAQLNFMIAEVREAVIQTILHVARRFPIIRFDAAMTLAKKHYHRLWFPPGGEGGAIPSRSEYGMTKPDFDSAFPKEFWREVVDRVAAEVPDTLLLAEAFWLMEGYFVRTLGMHRVYNSAFMNMLKTEDNAKYRQTIKNVIEFSPEVLKRFVNFMNNPDEATAVAQFGKDDKYYGVAVLMVTMPGLPMFGHGQIEGFTEKYGMEYRKAYWDEQPDQHMIGRHENEVFPLMRRRHLFSGAENFALYDFNTTEGWVDENVFAYSNRFYDERGIILYNNAYNTTRGWIHTSTPINSAASGEDIRLVRKTLAEALGLNTADGHLYAFRDHQSGLHYLRPGRLIAEQGLYAELNAYQFHAFLDFREIYDHDGTWYALANRLNGAGVPSLDDAYREMLLEPLLDAFRGVMNGDMLRTLSGEYTPEVEKQFLGALGRFLDATGEYGGPGAPVDDILRRATAVVARDGVSESLRKAGVSKTRLESLQPHITGANGQGFGHIIITTAVMGLLAGDRVNDWLLRKQVTQAFRDFQLGESTAYTDALLATLLAMHPGCVDLLKKEPSVMQSFFDDPLVHEYLLVNRHDGILWFNKERLDGLIHLLISMQMLRLSGTGKVAAGLIDGILAQAGKILDRAEAVQYRYDDWASSFVAVPDRGDKAV